MSADGRTLYVTSSAGVGVFSVDPSTGALTQRAGTDGCMTSNGSSGQCGVGTNLAGTVGIAVSPDDNSAYTASNFNVRGSIGLFTRQSTPSCSAVNRQTGFGTPIAITLRCADANGQPVTLAIASDPAHGTLGAIDQSTGAVTYRPTAGFSGTDTFTYAASDGTNASAPATATITVGPAPPLRLVVVKAPKAISDGVQFTLACHGAVGAACRINVSLATVETIAGKRVIGVSAKHKGRTKVVVVGAGRSSLSVGRSRSFRLSLSGRGRSLLSRFGRLPVTVSITLVNASKSHAVTKVVTINRKH
jgi:hypothetical protein